MSKTSIPKGTRDFMPEEMARRNYIFDTIKRVFVKYGYQPIETPSMENLSTLLGKYGEEGDRLLFKIANSGDILKDVDTAIFETRNSQKLISSICEKGLRYDLTVPFARFVVQHRNDITFPFKRYQMQPVWRADRPQKGRYREFYQCDADVIGSNSLINEVELIQMTGEVYSQLGLDVVLKINNRKVLGGIAEVIGEKERIIDITVAIDKLDKIGIDGVNSELRQKGVSEDAIIKLQPIISMSGNNSNKLDTLKQVLANSTGGMQGIRELETIFSYIEAVGCDTKLELDLTLARGLNYYTGAIFEVKSMETAMGSIGGGGRYDNLTDIFGMPNISGIGISYGAERIYDIMTELDKFPNNITQTTQAMIVNFGGEEELYALKLQKSFRKANINCEIYPENDKLKKQFGYADSKKTPFVVIAGADEMSKNSLLVKEMSTGTQILMTESEAIAFFIKKNGENAC